MDSGSALGRAEPLVRDLIATLGWDHERAEQFVSDHLAASPDLDDGEFWLFYLASGVQAALATDREDTSWPLCPRHTCHPLWLEPTEQPLAWRCPISGRKVAALGSLAGPTPGS